LVRSGFKKFVLCDFDKVEYSNLNRQFYFLDQAGMLKTEALKTNLLRINPGLEPGIVNERISADNVKAIFGRCDVIVEAFDRAEMKKIIAEAYAGSGKLFVSASGLAGWGNSDEIKITNRNGSFFIVGDLKSGISGKLPPCSPRVNVAAAKQADIILEWVLNLDRITG
ncbi:MAG: sulfur carrier protein ThiS adenylyltransferase ThiF, partial [Candidatus Omnitrophica bacterium]|nr:sulfur carrier protein ThiS adenylyltransferase ThiF [Candidatus Omnitrophota bacterium]